MELGEITEILETGSAWTGDSLGFGLYKEVSLTGDTFPPRGERLLWEVIVCFSGEIVLKPDEAFFGETVFGGLTFLFGERLFLAVVSICWGISDLWMRLTVGSVFAEAVRDAFKLCPFFSVWRWIDSPTDKPLLGLFRSIFGVEYDLGEVWMMISYSNIFQRLIRNK